MTVKDKLVECISVNLAKQRCGDARKKDAFYIEAELLLKQLLLDVLIERSTGDPLDYIECLENFQEICGWDFYDTWFVESMVFGN